jgi:hypothetical protein
MRNCAPRFLYGFINTDGVQVHVYIDDLSGTIMASLDFEALRRQKEDRQRAQLKAWKPPVKRNGYHKARDDK